MSLTIRRTDPQKIGELSGDNAANFCLGIEDGRLIESEDIVFDFAPWHIVHFLSSGTDWDKKLPAGFMIGGTYWAQIHEDHEPFRVLNAIEVSLVAQHLLQLSDSLVDERLHALSVNTLEIYGGPVPVEAFGQVKEVLKNITEFFDVAARDGKAVTLAMA